MEYTSRKNTFGKDAEHYLAELYSMNMNPPGSRKPDLKNDYLFFEVKS